MEKKRGPRKYYYTFETLSNLTGYSVDVLHQKSSKGHFDIKDLLSVYFFLQKCLATKYLEKNSK